MENVFLFIGTNVYALRQERKRWMQNFVEKQGEQNLLVLDGRTINTRDLLDEIRVAPFVGEHRLVIVDEVPRWTKEEVWHVFTELHPQTILCFISPSPDRRLGVTKVLFEKAVIKTFPGINNTQLRQWIGHVLARENASMTSTARNMLLERVGEDQEILEGEIVKLMIYAGSRQIEDKDVEVLVPPSREWVIWNLTDYLARKRRHDALFYADTLLRSGEDPVGLWSVLLWMVRSMVTVTSAIEGGKTPSHIDGIHPRTLRSLVALVRSLHPPELRAIVDETIKDDIRLKVGEYRVTVEEPQEAIALIDRLILRCT